MEQDAILDLIRRIPPGFVVTYGDLTPGAPRLGGRLMSRAPAGLPWWRVVRADGSLAKGSEQRLRLMDEGVPMRGARVLMAKARLPPEALIGLDPQPEL
jgi:methylated-DNA-protein-cysteine methyltransferase related protein